ncbi:MAG: ribosome maturation factor RimM [Cyanobacteria bacterium SBLK]|nr:ribosome maturation factor RimM [Cyanobacteria bacterium SBLK]
MKLLAVGKIVSPQGLNGELRVYPDSDFPERFLQPGTRWLQLPHASSPQQVELLSGRLLPGKKLYVIQLAEIEDRSQAEALRGAIFLVDAEDRPPLEADEYHVSDLLGLEVIVQSTGEAIGTVTDVYSAGNDLLEVTLKANPIPPAVEKSPPRQKKRSRSASPTVLIPFVPEIVPVVDLEGKRVEILPPPGLLEVNLANP